jgi:2'-5' RNA ligase
VVRLFVAVTPPVEVLDHLDLALATVRQGPAGRDDTLRWSARETWHLTTAFYGEVPDGQVAALGAALAATASSIAPYQLALRGAGLFAHRTVWVGVGGDVARQRAVVDATAQAAALVGVATDERPRQRAHLTVGRTRAGARPPGRTGARQARARPGRPVTDLGGVDGLVRALAVYAGPTWTVAELSLQRSEPGAGRGGGPRYTVVQTLPLGG